MVKPTRALSFMFVFLGLFLAGSSPSPTGAVIGLSADNASSFLGFVFFILGIIILLGEKEEK